MLVSIVDDVTDGTIHLVGMRGICAAYIRSTDDGLGPKQNPYWLEMAGKVKNWVDEKGGKAAILIRETIKAEGLAFEARLLTPGVYGLAVYPRGNASARRVTLAAIAGARNTSYS